MNNTYRRGFTLIELLVVIAIIGILASVVLASLNTSRDKSRDASVQQSLKNLQTQAQSLFQASGRCYAKAGVTCTASAPVAKAAGACNSISTDAHIFGDATIDRILDSADTINGTSLCTSAVTAGFGNAWAVAVVYPSDATKAWCVDSTGASKEITGAYGTQAGLDGDIAGSVCGS